jgi:hypothetical protein
MHARRTGAIATAALTILLLAPGVAFGARVESHIVSRTTGPAIAAELLSQLRSVDVGSDDATVTVASGSGTRDVHVSFGDIGRGLAAGKDGSALLGLTALPLLGTAFLRFVAFLARLSRS